MLVRIITAIIGATALFLGFAAYYYDDASLAVWAVPFVVALAASYVLTPQLEWAYYKRNPSDLEPPVVMLFEQRLPVWYQQLSAEQQEAFRKKTFLVRLGLDFKGQGFGDEGVPVDVQALIASQAARVVEAKHEFVLSPYETVVVYKHPFPSPAYPEAWHSSELYAEDGVLLLSVERALPGIFQPAKYFNITLYEWIRAAGTARANAAPQTLDDEVKLWVQDAIGLPPEAINWAAVEQVLTMEDLWNSRSMVIPPSSQELPKA